MSFQFTDTDTMHTSTIYNEKELSMAVFDTIKYYRDLSARLMNENKKLREEGKEMSDEQLRRENERLKERLLLSYGEFSSTKEMTAYEEFVKRHMHDRLVSRANGGRAPYLIPTGTGIGTNLKVVCPICGAIEDITDLEAW